MRICHVSVTTHGFPKPGSASSGAQEQGPRATRAMSRSSGQYTNSVGFARNSPGKGQRHCVLCGYAVGCIGFRGKGVSFQGRPLSRLLYNYTFFSKQEPCSLSQASATISRARVKQLKATRVLTAIRHLWEDKVDVDRDRTLGFPASCKQSPQNKKHTVKTLTGPSPWHNLQLGLGLGERAKTFPLISFKNSN